MAFEEGTARLACKGCGAIHLAKWSRMPVRERQTVRCRSCNHIISQGSSVRDYFEINLADPSAGPGNRAAQMDKFYNRAGFRAAGDPPYRWGFDLLDSGVNASVALDEAGVGGLYEVVGALAARSGEKTVREIEEVVVSISAEAFRPLVRHVIELGMLMGEWRDFGEHGLDLVGNFKAIDDATSFVPWWASPE